ncbi:MAG: SusC/RagA family TonB-linked outer membrane protein [Bacteroidetes bacterium MedPE-SWsnd-G1]|nr:MAG: SusC/RagA family TonB-linked outer membrane protein [Bacteroidetes bacterium MedPE-SWsnd-G1]
MKNNLLKKMFLVAFMLTGSVIFAQTVTGTVSDSNGPLPGASVVVKGSTNGANTDFDGNYSLDNVSTDAVLVVSFVGYETQEIAVAGQSVINVTLIAGAESLDEVVVTALGIKKETRALGYSLTEVKGEEVSLVKEVNAINSLQGKVAGVNITQNATGAAGSSRVIIRGNSSLTGNNQPLYIVDGIPVGNDNNGSAGLWGGSDGGDGISSLNSDDVESVSVLKGGAASALYGSRAANGVIIVTTKGGKGQEGFGVELASTFMADVIDTSLQDYQTSYGHGSRGLAPTSQTEALAFGPISWGAKLDGSSVIQWDGVSRPYSYVGNNAESFYETGTTFTNTLSISNATDKVNFRLSASDLDNKDIMPNAGLNRKSFSLNLGATLNERLTSQTNAKYIIENVQNRPRLSDSPGNANLSVALLPGNVDEQFMNPGADEDGRERGTSDNIYSTNPYFAAYNFNNTDEKNKIIASTSLRFEITDYLYALARAGIDHSTLKRTSTTPWGTAYQPEGSITESEIRYSQVDADIMLGFDKDVTDKLSVSALVGANSNYVERESLNLSGSRFIVPGLEDIANTNDQSRNRSYSETSIGSIYGSVELAWENWAYLNITGRNDWFSTLSYPGKDTPNNDFYPSVNGSLIVSELLEMDGLFNFLKVRGGYSQVAGGAQDAYQLALTYQIFGQGHLGQPLGRVNGGTVPNANLVAFNKDETEIGIDGRMLENRLNFDFAYYTNTTTNDIVNVGTSVFSGYGSATANIGELKNQGFEFLVGGTPVRTDNFEWRTSINGAYNESEIVATDADNGEISLGAPRTRNVEIKQIVGQPYGTIVGVAYVRNDEGQIMYDIDADGVPIAQEGGREILGQGVPPWTMGWTNTLSYKNFTMNFLIDGKFGGQIFSGTNTLLYGNGLHKKTLEGREDGLGVTGIDAATGAQFNVVVAPEDLGTYWGNINDIAEEFVEDSDYIKFRQLSIGYSFPSTLMDKTFLQSVNVSFIATNLFYLSRSIDNIDPESAYNVGNAQGLEYFGVPSTRSYGLNLNVKF